jgi:hypothetical protein
LAQSDRFATDGGLAAVNGAIVNVPLDRRYNTPNDFALSRDHNLQFSFNYQVGERSEARITHSPMRSSKTSLLAQGI